MSTSSPLLLPSLGFHILFFLYQKEIIGNKTKNETCLVLEQLSCHVYSELTPWASRWKPPMQLSRWTTARGMATTPSCSPSTKRKRLMASISRVWIWGMPSTISKERWEKLSLWIFSSIVFSFEFIASNLHCLNLMFRWHQQMLETKPPGWKARSMIILISRCPLLSSFSMQIRA